MATPAWPVSLPQLPLYRGLQKTLGNNLLVFQPDVGRALRRRRTSARDDTYAVRFSMSGAQVQALQTFYGQTLGDGALSFTAVDPLTLDGVVTLAFDGQVDIMPVAADVFEVSFSLVRYG